MLFRSSADRASIAKNVMDVANAPGKKIYPGELKKGLDLLAKGKKINYEGATRLTKDSDVSLSLRLSSISGETEKNSRPKFCSISFLRGEEDARQSGRC